ncbi:unnamed protein product [Hymenolepis diminuta]|uniref:Uncharacterized protein n=1 Tax=Hymenolepis diminuta TaxID=6216 RepID=A0A564Z429_HYMDI|nr:unnamed protein product [Hymenolepis diminuta]
MVLCEQQIIVLHGLKTRHVCNEPAVVNRLCISYISPSVIQGQVADTIDFAFLLQFHNEILTTIKFFWIYNQL